MDEPSQKAIDYLLANPDTANFFDEKFGNGSAEKILSELGKPEKKSMPVSEQVKRAAGLTARSIAPTLIGTEVGSLGGPVGAIAGSMAVPTGDVLNALINTIASPFTDKRLIPVSQAVQNLMTYAGVPAAPETQTPGEKVIGSTMEAISGLRNVPAFTQAAKEVASPVAKEVLAQMGMAPAAQAVAAPISAAAGQTMTQATDNPILGLLTSLVSGGAAGARMKEYAPQSTAAQLKQASGDAYNRASQAGALITPESLQNVGNRIVKTLENKIVIDPEVDKDAVAVANRLTKTFEQPQTIEQLDLTRQFIRNSQAAGGRSGEYARAALKEFDNYIDSLGAKDIVAGNSKEAVSALKEARDLWKRASKVQVIDDLLSSAELRAGNYTQSGFENSVRRKLISLADSDEMKFFSKTEQDAIKSAAKGGDVLNLLRYLGKFSPSGLVSGVLSPAASAGVLGSILPPAAAAAVLPAVGYAAKKGAERMSANEIEYLRSLMATGQTPQITGTATRNIPTTAIRGLLSY